MKKLLAVYALFLVGCGAPTMLGAAGLETANTVVRGVCGAILATDRPDAAAAAFSDGQRKLAEALAAAAPPEQLEDAKLIVKELQKLAEEQRDGFARLQALAPQKAVSTPCPAAVEGVSQ